MYLQSVKKQPLQTTGAKDDAPLCSGGTSPTQWQPAKLPGLYTLLIPFVVCHLDLAGMNGSGGVEGVSEQSRVS